LWFQESMWREVSIELTFGFGGRPPLRLPSLRMLGMGMGNARDAVCNASRLSMLYNMPTSRHFTSMRSIDALLILQHPSSQSSQPSINRPPPPPILLTRKFPFQPLPDLHQCPFITIRSPSEGKQDRPNLIRRRCLGVLSRWREVDEGIEYLP